MNYVHHLSLNLIIGLHNQQQKKSIKVITLYLEYELFLPSSNTGNNPIQEQSWLDWLFFFFNDI